MSAILVVSPLSSHPPQNGARRRIHTMLSALKARGHSIHFVYTACEDADLEAMARRMRRDWTTVDVIPSGTAFPRSQGEDYGLDDWINPAALATIPELARRYGVTHCLVNYVFQSRYFEGLPAGVLKILDTHDKLSRREIFAERGIEPGFYYTTEAEEQRGLARADIVLAIQDNEVDYFARAGAPVTVVGHAAPVAYLEKRYTRLQTLGYVGAHNKFNIHALERFIPAFIDYAEGPGRGLVLSLAGNVSRHFEGLEAFQSPHVRYEGFVDDVARYFDGIDLYVNPTLMGTGLKIKSVEALSHGLPILSTKVGWDGLAADPGFHDIDDVPGLIAAIETVRQRGFDLLTRMSNFSKASYAEYQINLTHNLENLFSRPVAETLDWARRNPRYIGSLQAQNPDFVTLDAIDRLPARPRPRIAHLVNPVRMPRSSDLYIAQPLAFTAMARARDAARDADVLLVARSYPEDADYMAGAFDLKLTLQRSARDLPGFETGRKLPLLAEMFSLAGLPDDVTHVVYTNSDIGVHPHFYDFVAAEIARGHDAIVINRRTLPKRFTNVAELPEIHSEFGQDHPGFDCFVVSRAVLERCDFGRTLVGVHLIGRVAFWNILAHARSVAYHPAASLTFHIGDDVPSKGRATLPYIRHNLREGAATARRLRADPGGLADPARIQAFERVLSVTPGEIQGRFDPATEPRNRVFLHSFFRTGSTYFFQKIRAQKHWTAYYEPFHEDLALFSPEKIDEFRERHANSKFRHAGGKGDAPWLFAEYEPLLDRGVAGVRNYDRRLSYCIDFDGEIDAIRAYVEGLSDAAPTENVFYQFNRTALRQAKMKALFPDDFHIYLSRSVRDIWGSYLSFRQDAVYGFLRNNLAVLNFNAQSRLVKALSQHVPVADMPFTFFFHKNMGEIFHHYTLEQHYLIHATFWHAARVQAERRADFVIDMEVIARDRLARLEAEAVLAAQRINVAFGDVNYHAYPVNTLLLSRRTLTAIETRAEAIVAEVYNAPPPRGGAPHDFPPPRHEELVRAVGRFRGREMAGHRTALHAQRAQAMKRLGRAAPALGPGADLDAAALGAKGVLFFGFHQPDKGQVWASGSYAMLRLSVPADAGTEIVLKIKMHPALAQRAQEMNVFVNDRFSGRHWIGPAFRDLVLRISPAAIARAAGLVEIGLVVPRLFQTPQPDRRLSFGLAGMAIRTFVAGRGRTIGDDTLADEDEDEEFRTGEER